MEIATALNVRSQDVCLKTAVNYMGQSLKNAVQMATLSPAKIINVNDRKGSIEKNKDADIIIIDKNFNVLKTFVRGTKVYERA